MSVPDASSFGLPHIISGLAVAAVAGLWRLLTGKASKEELIAAVNMLREQNAAMLERVDDHYEEASESRDKLYNKVDEINRGLGATMVALSRLQGQLDRNDSNG